MKRSTEPDNAGNAPIECTDYRVLLGWNGGDLGDRMSLRIQTLNTGGDAAAHELSETCLFLTMAQAVQLATYLYAVAGQSPPAKRSGSKLARFFGR